MSDDRTTAIRAAATGRTADADARVRKALSAITNAGSEVSFVAVATAADVSRQFLYSRPELRTEIERLRAQAVLRLPARRSLKYVPRREREQVARDLKPIYTATRGST